MYIYEYEYQKPPKAPLTSVTTLTFYSNMGVCSTVPAKFLTVTKDKASKTQEDLNTRSLDTWTVEINAASFSLACFAAICGVLIAYDQIPSPDLRYGLTLNAVISILATGCKSSLLFTLGESISQAKWSWFTRGAPKPLVHMQTIDSASRGPSGTIMMLFGQLDVCRSPQSVPGACFC